MFDFGTAEPNSGPTAPNLNSTIIRATLEPFTCAVVRKHDKMLSQFQRSYQGVEQGLERLTESIAAYNPSTSAADELVAADNVVNDNLEQRTIMRTVEGFYRAYDA